MKKFLIIGGSGFVGTQICRTASQEKQRIISLSRHGKPQQASRNELPNVQWVTADVLTFQDWDSLLSECSAVIHTVGIIEEKPEIGVTYKKAIFETARVVGKAVAASKVKKFIYLSASAGGPETPAAYMEWKRAAEHFLDSLPLQLTVLRPGMIYGKERPETLVENSMLQELLDSPMFHDELYPNRPLPVEAVAAFALKAAQGDIGPGIFGVDDIERYYLETHN